MNIVMYRVYFFDFTYFFFHNNYNHRLLLLFFFYYSSCGICRRFSVLFILYLLQTDTLTDALVRTHSHTSRFARTLFQNDINLKAFFLDVN